METRGHWGSGWEKFIVEQADLTNHVVAIRIPNHVVGLYSGRPIQKKSDVDFMVSIKGTAVLFDAKQTHKERFYFADHIFTKDQKKIHQYNRLLEAHHKDTIAGYFVHFAELHKIGFIPIKKVYDLFHSGAKSVDPSEIHTQDDYVQIDWNYLFLAL